MEAMHILGISGSVVGHDPSATLLRDGQVLGAIEEERLSREKHRAGIWPQRAVLHLLQDHQLTEADVDLVAFYWSMEDLWSMILSTLRYMKPGRIRNGLEAMRNKLVVGKSFAEGPRIFLGYVFNRRPLPPVRHVPHHVAHAASVHLVSPFETSATAVIDGAGEYLCTSLYQWDGTRPRFLQSTNFPHSLGYAYAAITEYLGFHCLADEWKVMGLAPYGSRDPQLQAFFEDLIVLRPEGQYRINTDYVHWAVDYLRDPILNEKGHARLGGPPRRHGSVPGEREADIAFNFQARIEETIFHILRHLQKVTGETRLTLSGGVALNCKANGKILEHTDFEELFLQPASNDAGGSMGAALYAWQELQEFSAPRWRMTSPYLGPGYSTEEIRVELEKTKLSYEEAEDPADLAAELLAEGKIIGWFQGRLEWGPRALGNRSILADARHPWMKDRVNAAVKFREGFRPFAPAVPVERAADYFEHVAPSPFMTMALRIRPERRDDLGAVCHVDGTGRLQTVAREVNPRFHRVLERFGELTGVPVVLNTSFNVKGEPIVCTPTEAIRCFCGTGLDALIMDRFVLRKETLSGGPSEEYSTVVSASGD